MYQIRNVIIPIQEQPDLVRLLSKKLKLPASSIVALEILRSSLDARQKNQLKYNLTLKAEIDARLELNNDIQIFNEPQPYVEAARKISTEHPFIIGAGPAGLFAALALVEKGFRPYIFERGDCLEKRSLLVDDFWKNGSLNENCNVQFGEGGAGAFSDGKLTSRKSDFYTNRVTDYLIRFGADKKIAYEAMPHLGTDGIRNIVLNIRNHLESSGCRFFWKHKLETVISKNNNIKELIINGEKHNTEIVILAIGNAARDTFEILNQNIQMDAKPFAIGFRIEHPQDFINEAFYGKNTDFSVTGPAAYRLTAQTENRGVYSFCMCPGGTIIATSSEVNGIVTNGMSNSLRDGRFANSAIVATVNERDFGNSILAGMQYQRKIEQYCFNQNLPYFAPAQSAEDYLRSIQSAHLKKASYSPGIYPFDLNKIFSNDINNAIKTGLKSFDRKVNGFIKNGILVAPETRTSSPVRILRDAKNFYSSSALNLYPCGEGSGYAGGIMSSAADGYKVGSVFL
jgi:hypothetical protein